MIEYIHYGNNVYDPNKVIQNKQGYIGSKPDKGLWGSRINAKWGWKDWCKSEGYSQRFGLKFGFKFRLKSSARIFVINSLSDYLRMPEKYLISYQEQFDDKKYICIDWEKLSIDYDGLLLTYDGYCEISDLLDIPERDGIYRKSFNSWDCETLLVFSLDCISDIKSLRKF
jgi:hypothetical protein